MSGISESPRAGHSFAARECFVCLLVSFFPFLVFLRASRHVKSLLTRHSARPLSVRGQLTPTLADEACELRS